MQARLFGLIDPFPFFITDVQNGEYCVVSDNKKTDIPNEEVRIIMDTLINVVCDVLVVCLSVSSYASNVLDLLLPAFLSVKCV